MLLIGFLVLSGISGGLAAQMYSARLEGGQVLGPYMVRRGIPAVSRPFQGRGPSFTTRGRAMGRP